MLKKEEIIAMAVAAIAEEKNIEFTKIHVLSFEEEEKTNLEKYIQEKGIKYVKYQLGD